MMKLSKLLTNSRGFTLPELMLGVSILVGVALSGAILFRDQRLSQKKMDDDQKLSAFHNDLAKFISLPENCNATLKNFISSGSALTAPLALTTLSRCQGGCEDPNSETESYDYNAYTPGAYQSAEYLSVGDYIDEKKIWKIESFQILDSKNSTGSTRLRVTYSRNFNGKIQNKIKDISLNLRFSGGHFKECLDPGESNINNFQSDLCKSFGLGSSNIIVEWDDASQTCQFNKTHECSESTEAFINNKGELDCRPLVKIDDVTDLEDSGPPIVCDNPIPVFEESKIKITCDPDFVDPFDPYDNKAPVKDSSYTGALAVHEEEDPFSYTFLASDPDGHALTFSCEVTFNGSTVTCENFCTTYPSGGSCSTSLSASQAQFNFTPQKSFLNVNNSDLVFVFRATDEYGASVEENITIKVWNWPELMPIGNKSINAEDMSTLTFQVLTTHPGSGDNVRYDLATELLPPGATFNHDTGEFSYTPGADQDGTYTFTISLTDLNFCTTCGTDPLKSQRNTAGYSKTDQETITITVTGTASPPPLDNSPPVKTSTYNNTYGWGGLIYNIEEGGDPFAYTFTATDPDPGDTLTFSCQVTFGGTTISCESFCTTYQSTGDCNAVITGTSAMFDFTPEPTFLNVNMSDLVFKFRATDDEGAYAEEVITLSVWNTPKFAAIGNKNVNGAGETLSFQVASTHPGSGDIIKYRYEYSTLPPGATYNFNSDTGEFSYTTSAGQDGVYEVSFLLYDQNYCVECVAPGARPAREANGAFTEKVTITITVTGTGAAMPPGGGVFITRWNTKKTSSGSSASNQITLPTYNGGSYNFTVDWGDGTTSEITSWNDPDRTHTYATQGNKTITMTGTYSAFRFGAVDKNKIITVDQWGSNRWKNMHKMFEGCLELNNFSASDTPVLDDVTDMSYMFAGSTFNGSSSAISLWNTGSIENMSYMFLNASSFQGDVTTWDTSSVTDMRAMFSGASAFNENIGNWITSNVTRMDEMFMNATSFSQNIGEWDTSKVTHMVRMFSGASTFNSSLGNWDTKNVQTMAFMFADAIDFNQDLNNFDTRNVRYMQKMFGGAAAFNGRIDNFKTGKVENMSLMFDGARVFNRKIDKWDTSSVTNMTAMFRNARKFNENISQWDTSKVTSMAQMFEEAHDFNQNLEDWDVSKVTNMNRMFFRSGFNKNINDWNISSVTTMLGMFAWNTAFNQPLNKWNTSNVTNMKNTFHRAENFNRDISSWNTSKVTDMTGMFEQAHDFNQNLSGWNVDAVTSYGNFSAGAWSWTLPKPSF